MFGSEIVYLTDKCPHCFILNCKLQTVIFFEKIIIPYKLTFQISINNYLVY